MKAPTDKSNDIIQIEITTACDLFTCSNCTRLLPFRRDYRHMTLDCFREAVRSVADWPGIVALFGGNPCSHPQFPEICAILEEEIPEQRHRGIWTNNLLKHGELVRRVFYPYGRFNLNAHANERAAVEFDRWLPKRIIERSRRMPAQHGPIMMDRQDYGISDADWIAMREACDINVHWSSAIVQRDGKPYAYFCEVAGALDGIRGENFGIPAVPGWWRWKMDRFESQVRNCCDRGCGVPLRLKGHLDTQDTYDLSPAWKQDTRVQLLRGAKQVQIVEHAELPTEQSHELTDYMKLRVKR